MRARTVHSTEYQAMLRRLVNERIAAGLSQRQVSGTLNRAYNYVHKVESGERQLNVIELMDYCTAIGLNFDNFVKSLHAEIRELRNRDA